MRASGLMFCFALGLGVGVLIRIAIRPRRSSIKIVECTLVMMVLLMLGAAGLPNFVRARSASGRSACLANLKQIQGAKEAWALQLKKADTEVPVASDLFGDKKLIRIEPTCPVGGTYALGSVREKPTCPFGGQGHRWEDLPKENSQPSSDTTIVLGFSLGLGTVMATAALSQVLRMQRRTSS